MASKYAASLASVQVIMPKLLLQEGSHELLPTPRPD